MKRISRRLYELAWEHRSDRAGCYFFKDAVKQDLIYLAATLRRWAQAARKERRA
jgi:hypothetical protein